MEMAFFVKAVMVLLGAGLLGADLLALARRKIDSSFSVVWGLIAVVLILLGLFLTLGQLSDYVSWPAVIFIVVGLTALLFGLYKIIQYISELTTRNQELVIQVSLLNEESRQLKEAVRQLQQNQQNQQEQNRPQGEEQP